MNDITTLLRDIDAEFKARDMLRIWITKDRSGVSIWQAKPYFDEDFRIFSGGDFLPIKDAEKYKDWPVPTCICVHTKIPKVLQ